MTKAEKDIMRHFRQYHIGVNEMLCFTTTLAKANSTEFQNAMSSLIRNGLVIKERHRHAYSLTHEGFTASLSV
jgi:predicted transcriptional regulator